MNYKEYFEDSLYGMENVESLFHKAFQSRKNSSWMIIGKRGIGKSILSFRLASFVINKELSTKLLHNILLIKPEEQNKSGVISKEQIDVLIKKLRLSASNNEWRVAIINKLDNLNINGMNALLKIVEDIPDNICFIFIVDELAKVISTIKSRCQKLYIKGPSKEECFKILKIKLGDLNDKEVHLLSNLSNFSPGVAIDIYKCSAHKLYFDLLTSIQNKDFVFKIDKKLLNIEKNNNEKSWVISLLLTRLMNISITVNNSENFLFDEEKKIIEIIRNRFSAQEILLKYEDLNRRMFRIKTLNSNISMELSQFLYNLH